MTRPGFRSKIPENPVYCELLYEISILEHDGNSDQIYASSELLQERTGKVRKTLDLQLRHLLKMGYLAQSESKGKKVTYRIHYPKLSRLFIEYLYKLPASKKSKEIAAKRSKDIERISLNPYLNAVMEYAISKVAGSLRASRTQLDYVPPPDLTLNSVFDKIIELGGLSAGTAANWYRSKDQDKRDYGNLLYAALNRRELYLSSAIKDAMSMNRRILEAVEKSKWTPASTNSEPI